MSALLPAGLAAKGARAVAGLARADLHQFAQAYPDRSACLCHALCDHPLLTIGSLIELAKRMEPNHVEVRRGNVSVDMPDGGAPHTGNDPVAVLRNIENARSWVMFRWAQNDPAYKALLADLLADLAPVVHPVTGPMLQHEAFIFVSSPRCVTPFHFDPEHNILMQIKGEKRFTHYPANDPATAPQPAHEAFHLHGANMLPWCDSMASRGTVQTMEPGDALYVPVKSPHHVEVGDEPSISLSITWRSRWCEEEADACTFNGFLRSKGLAPRPTAQWPRSNRAKAVVWRVLRKLGQHH